MNKRTVVQEIKQLIKGKIPAAGTTESLRTVQSELSRLLRELEEISETEKENLREAFNRGMIHGMLNTGNRKDEVMYGFEQYYKDRYGDDKA